jgi:glycosyltransferase involved in cell wall biosynthesis
MDTHRKIRVAHVVGSLQYGGAENQVVQILNGLNPSRTEKYLITFRDVETGNSRALKPEIKHLKVKLRRWGQIGCIFRLYRLSKAVGMDVVQSHLFHPNLYVAIAARLAGVPVVVTTEHGKNLWKTPIHHFIEKRIVSPLVTMRVAVSKDIRDIRVQSGDVPEDKITVITNCVETPENIRRNGPRKKVRIGTVGRLVPAKAYGTLITAFKRLKEVGLSTELIFVGDGGERSKLELMAQDLGIAEDITFTGFQADVNRFLANFDIFVLSSIREGIPVSMLEAMAMSVSVVATRVGGIPEVIEHNVDGLLVDSENTEMLSQALRRLVEDGLLRKRIGEAGRKKVTRLFSKEAICRQYENLYRTLLRAVD